MTDCVTLSVTDGIADVRLNRPDKHNALNLDMFQAIVETAESLCGDNSLRVVVISGNGPSFCSGLDVAGTMAIPGFSSAIFEVKQDQTANQAQRTATAWQEVPVPVIAAIHGYAFGAGLQLALGADIRFCHPDSHLAVMEMKYGLIPDMGITQTLIPLVGMDIAKELTFTAEIIPGERAATLGLVTHLSDNPIEQAMNLASKIAKQSPDAIRKAKALFNTAWRSDVSTGLQLEAKLQKQLLGSPNQLEAVQSTMQKRDANFKDPD